MCDPVTAATMALSMGRAALQISSVNRSLEAQAESVNRQTEMAYAEQAYETREQAEAAVDEGYAASVAKKKSVGEAKVQGANLGIFGVTANELVAEQEQIGNFNMATAEEARRNADTAYEIGTKNTYNNAQAEVKSIEAQSPTAFESLLTIGASGLQGYLLGGEIKDVFKGVPKGLKK